MNAAAIYNGLEFPITKINRTFKIKVFGMFNGKKINTLVGVSGLIRIVGMEMANKMLRKAFASKEDKFTAKLRRGIKVTFYYY